MKRSEMITKLKTLFEETLYDYDELMYEEAAIKVLEEVEKAGMVPPSRTINEGYYHQVINKWEKEDE